MARETGRTGYKVKLKKKLETMFPGIIIHPNDPHTSHQGIPDWTLYFGEHWAMLETKAFTKAERQPNQEYWVDHYNQLSFASFIYPENEEEVLNALQSKFASSKPACHS